jgi:hypothetical protein
MNQKIQRFILLMVGILAMSLAIGYLVFAWVEPGANPPQGNVPAPINVGDVAQGKLGGLVIGSQDTTLLGGHIGIAISGNTNDKIRLYGTQADPHTIWLGNNKGLRFWDSANGELMRITNTGKVSIGTSPAQKLTVSGGILAATGTPTCIPSDVGYSFIGDGCYDTGMFSTGDGVLKFYTNQIDTVTMTGGNVGIGATDPGYKLDVNGALRLRPSSQPTGANGVIYYDSATNKFRCYQNGAWVDCIGGGAGGETYWVLSGSNLYTSSTAWNVGIGTTSPVEKLQVAGNVNIDNRLFVRSGSGWSGSPAISLAIGDNDTGFNWVSDGNLAIYTNNAERMRIDSSGNVGIGTTAPAYKLDVNGDINTSGVYRRGGTAGISLSCGASQVIKGAIVSGGIITAGSCAADETGGGGYWTLSGSNLYPNDTTWNVGIGGTNPQAKLDVRGRTYINPRAGFISPPTIDLAIGDTDTGLNWISDGNLAIYTNNAERMRITSDGNVGIGTTSPVEKLQVAGNVNIDNRLFVRSGSGWSGSPAISLAIGDNDTGFNWVSDGNLAIYTNNAERVRIKSDGHVQFSGNIGTNGYSPNSGLPSGWGGGVHTWDLVSEGSIATRQICIDTTGSGDGWAGLVCQTSLLSGSGAANKVAFWTGANTLSYNTNFHWDNANTRLGIGTATPAATLHVQGGILSLIGSDPGAAVAAPFIRAQATTGFSSNPIYSFWYQSDTGMSNPAAQTIAFVTAGTERMRITSSGNVGIGTDPTQKLDVNGNLNVSGGYYQGGTRGLPGADIRPGARITLSHRLPAGSCTGDYYLAIYYIAVPAGKTLRVWSMGKSGEPSNSGVMVDNIDDGLAPITTTSYYLEGSPLLTATAGQRVYFGFDCNGSESAAPAGYWVISIE